MAPDNGIEIGGYDGRFVFQLEQGGPFMAVDGQLINEEGGFAIPNNFGPGEDVFNTLSDRLYIQVTSKEITLLTIEEEFGITSWDTSSDRMQHLTAEVDSSGFIPLTETPLSEKAVQCMAVLSNTGALKGMRNVSPAAPTQAGEFKVNTAIPRLEFYAATMAGIKVQYNNFYNDDDAGKSVTLSTTFIPATTSGYFLMQLGSGYGKEVGIMLWNIPYLMRKPGKFAHGGPAHKEGPDNTIAYNIQTKMAMPKVSWYWE